VNIAACVLAAGSSRRMGSAKAWLDAGGRPFVLRILDSFRAAGVEHRWVVGAPGDERLRQACATAGAQFLVNPDPARGMLSSLHVCLEALGQQDTIVDALFVTPVDCPRVLPETIALLAREFAASRAPVVRPRHAGRGGHPALFSATVFGELLQAPLAGGARTVVRAHARDRLEVEVDDAAVLDDIDTATDWQRSRSQ
jgi:molybdenum cofactor cytidylyltransferase